MKKRFTHFLASILLLYFGVSIAADDWLTKNIYGPSQVGIVKSLPVDLNQDGLLDVVSLSLDDGHLRSYINQGDLTFIEEYLSTDIIGGFQMAPVDINGDSHIDFLVTSIETHEVVVFIAEADSYRKQVIAQGVVLPTDAQAGDLDGDGLLDVVSISFEENRLYVHPQTAPGVFSSLTIDVNPDRPRKIIVHDFDGDFLPDILLASSADNSIRLLTNVGGFSFVESLISDQATEVRNIIACQLNGQPLMDFLVAASGDNKVVKYNNLGQGQFLRVELDAQIPGVNGMVCADIDDDGDNELIAVASLESNLYSVELSGSPDLQLVSNSRDGYVSLAVGKFDATMQTKILTQSYFEGRNLFYNPTALNEEEVVWELFPDGAYQVKSADLDADGDEDVVGVSLRDDHVFWLEKTQNQFTLHTITHAVDGPQSIAIGDLDGDGDLDLVTAGAWDDKFWQHLNNGQGSFNSSVLFSNANNAARSVISDFTGDSLADVLIASSLDDSVRLLVQQNGTFEAQLIDNDLVGAYDIKAVDIDQNGLLDIVATGLRDSEIVLYSQSTAGTFDKVVLASGVSRSNVIQSSDFFGNSLPEISYINNQELHHLTNSSGLVFKMIQAFYSWQNLLDFHLHFLGGEGNLRVVSSSDTALIKVTDFQSLNLVNEWTIENLFAARSLASTRQIDEFYLASNIDNSVKMLTKDLIMKASFEISIQP